MKGKRCIGCMEEFFVDTDICPHCGYPQTAGPEKPYFLKPGTVLENRYIIGRALGSGGFGITYLAWDRVLSIKIALKEYFPSEYASRLPETDEVCAFDGEKSDRFEEWLNNFVDEALRLVKLNHLDGIMHVYDSFITNCTAYIVMEYVEGKTVKELLLENGPFSYEETVDIACNVLYSLEGVHKNGIIHRDIAPDNIVKTKSGKSKLIDFGTAGNMSRGSDENLSIFLKTGYAPIEQYSADGEQGPWTDIYAMAAVMYHMITGKLPQPAPERAKEDKLLPPSQIGYKIPKKLEHVIMKALSVDAKGRYKSAAEFANAIKDAVDSANIFVKYSRNIKNLKLRTKIIVGAAALVSVALIVLIIMLPNMQIKEMAPNGAAEELIENYEGQVFEYIKPELSKKGIKTEVKTVFKKGIKPSERGVIKSQSIVGVDIKEIVADNRKIKFEVYDYETVPDVNGKTLKAAKNILKGKRVKCITNKIGDIIVRDKKMDEKTKVIKTRPKRNTKVEIGSVVVINYKRYKYVAPTAPTTPPATARAPQPVPSTKPDRSSQNEEDDSESSNKKPVEIGGVFEDDAL